MEALIGFNSIHAVRQTLLLLQLLSSAQRLVRILRPELRTVGHRRRATDPVRNDFPYYRAGLGTGPWG